MTDANCQYPTQPWLAGDGDLERYDRKRQDCTVEILRDSATNLTDSEIWLEVNYYGSAPIQRDTITDARLTSATAADQTTSAKRGPPLA